MVHTITSDGDISELSEPQHNTNDSTSSLHRRSKLSLQQEQGGGGGKVVGLDPLPRPPFTLKELRDAIPPHCFERSLARSLLHLLFDFTLVASLALLVTTADAALVGYLGDRSWLGFWALRTALWGAYWYYQGVVFFGLWILAHECGHGAFSASDAVNSFVGLCVHSALYVPYHSWRISHAKHHLKTGHLDDDEVFVPTKKSKASRLLTDDISEIKSPLRRLYLRFYRSGPGIVMRTFFMLLSGWPLYLIMNATGKDYPEKDGQANHFLPSSPVFLPKNAWHVLLSDAGLIAWSLFLVFACFHWGFLDVLSIYGVPLLVNNACLVVVTHLQHTDAKVPHFDSSEWSWLRGALCTVDRDFGFVFNTLSHHIADTHVCHHLFSKLPFYHAQEATEALKKVLGPYYRSDSTPIPVALFKAMRDCVFVEDDAKIGWYKPAVN